MIHFKQAAALSSHLAKQKQKGLTIGFVPTMGALHEGHLSLLQKAAEETDLVVCSIFVNPTQFNNADDFSRYPVTTNQDTALLVQSPCDVLFMPSRNEIYPAGYQAETYDLGPLEGLLEGHYRPGHFQGVCQVVDRLLQVTNPDYLFMGEKDYQQCMVVKKLLLLKHYDGIQLVISPTMREKDGLAMSSRNLRLNADQRSVAPAIFKELEQARTTFGQRSLEEIKTRAVEQLTKNGFKVDYFEIADTTSLQPLSDSSKKAVALVAAYLGDVRLIDNMAMN